MLFELAGVLMANRPTDPANALNPSRVSGAGWTHRRLQPRSSLFPAEEYAKVRSTSTDIAPRPRSRLEWRCCVPERGGGNTASGKAGVE